MRPSRQRTNGLLSAWASLRSCLLHRSVHKPAASKQPLYHRRINVPLPQCSTLAFVPSCGYPVRRMILASTCWALHQAGSETQGWDHMQGNRHRLRKTPGQNLPAPGASGLDHFGTRRGGRATLAPPQALLGAHCTREGRGRFLLLVCSTRFPWSVSSISGKSVVLSRITRPACSPCRTNVTHLKCTVDYLPERQVIFCPCHSAQFSTTGAVLAGPARVHDRFAVSCRMAR